MKFHVPQYPTDTLSRDDKYLIYYCKVVDLAVRAGLLTSDPMTEIGHFAFSEHYSKGKSLQRQLHAAIREYHERHPNIALERDIRRDEEFLGAAEQYRTASDEEKIKDLIKVGASYRVWPHGTSFTLTYPWDLSGRGQQVRFRDDLSIFTKRRILEILKQAGKLRDPDLFVDLDSESK
jgi:hypothetical protein